MKKLVLGLVALMALTFVACDDSDDPTMFTVGFEDVTLDASGLAQNDSVSGSIASGDLSVTCSWSTSAWGTYGSGFSVTDHDNDTTAGYMNPYSCIAKSGAKGSTNFATFYSSGDSVKFNAAVDMESIMLCNNTYAYLSMRDGDAFAKKFGGADGTDEDYFKLTIMLYGADNTMIGEEDFYLADFRGDADYIINEWTNLDLSTYKAVSYLKFDFESTDVSNWGGYNTPSYFCLDNISYYAAE